MEASAEERSGYLDFSRVSPGELLGMGAALVLLASLWLPWFTTSSSNPNSRLPGGAHSGDISLNIGYFVALLASIGLLAAGYLRQAVYETARKPPGVI